MTRQIEPDEGLLIYIYRDGPEELFDRIVIFLMMTAITGFLLVVGLAQRMGS